MKRVYLIISCVALLLSTALATTYPLTLTDDLGRTVTLTSEPQRIVTMIPSHTETVCALGACERLVGIDTYSNYPQEVSDLPVLGSAFSPNIEAIFALEPDLVLVDESSGIADALTELGLTVYAGTAQTYDDVFAKFEVIGQMLNTETQAAVLSGEVKGAVDTIAALTEPLTAPSVYYELDSSPYSVGPASFIGVLITKAGGANIVEAGMGDFPQLDPEFVVVANPEVIVLADARHGESSDTLAARPAWDGIAALQTGRVAELSAEEVDMLNRPGPRMAEAVKILVNIFHPDLF